LPKSDLIWGAVSGVMYYALAFWLYLRALHHVPASVAGAFLNLVPVFAVGTAFVVLEERLSDAQWLGAITILLSVSMQFSRKEAPAMGT
jgi:drug/metabolite transporter (DMT)-like permease